MIKLTCVEYSIRDSVKNSVLRSVWYYVRGPVVHSVGILLWNSVRYSVRDSVMNKIEKSGEK